MKTISEIDAFRTKANQSYWNSNGAYQRQYNDLYENRVPASGAAESVHGELIRAASRLFYEYCNNGNCNAAESEMDTETCECQECGGTGIVCQGEDDEEVDCTECGGSGEIEEDVQCDPTVTSFYKQFIQLIRIELSKQIPEDFVYEMMYDVELIITTNSRSATYFSEENMQKYNKMVDYIVWYVLNSEDSKLPSWYEVD